MSRIAIFGYGSLASPKSAALSLGRPVEPAAVVRIRGWRRRWNGFRDNAAVEKTFALGDGTVPPYVVGLNIERDPASEGANGVLIEVTEGEVERLDLRELRYDRVEVDAEIEPLGDTGLPDFDRVVLYTAKAVHRMAQAPPGAIVIAEYVRTVEAAFAALGPGQLDLFHETTDPPPVEPSEATLVADRIPPGNPRRW